MARNILIGFGTQARQGKDWLAQYVLEQVAPAAKKYALAAHLKGWLRVMRWMEEKDSPLLQLVGTEIFRDRVNVDHWIRTLSLEIQEDDPPIALITDVRYPNEKEWIEASGGFVVKVIRLWHNGTVYRDTSRSGKHRSETALENVYFPFTVRVQSGNLAGLEKEGDRIVGYIRTLLAENLTLGTAYPNYPRARKVLG
jgi:hypothetical protein